MIADGWTITDDPLQVPIGTRSTYIDLGVERQLLSAERGTDLIAVEIQSFVNLSPIKDLHQAVGQYLVYRSVLKEARIERRRYLAIPDTAFDYIWNERIGEIVRNDYAIRLLVYLTSPPRIRTWIEPHATATS